MSLGKGYAKTIDPVRFARRVYREFAPVILTQGQTVTMPEATQLGRMGLGRLLIGELRNLHYELEVGHYFDADGNVVRQQLQSVPKSINVHRIIRPFHVSPKVQTIDQGRDNEEIKVASGSKHVLDDHMPPLRLHPTDDLRMLSGKTKTGQVSLVMKEDLEPATFVDEIFARCIETKINSTYEAVVRHALPEVWD